MNKAMIVEKLLQLGINKFPSIVRPKDLNFFLVLGMDHVIKMNKFLTNFGFRFEEINPS